MPEEQGDKPSSYDNLISLEAFYRYGARSPIPDITEKILGLTSGQLHSSLDALRRGPAGATLSSFIAAPTFVSHLTQSTKDTFYAELPDEITQTRTPSLDLNAVYAGVDGILSIYFQNSSGLSLNMKKLEDSLDIEKLHLIMNSDPFQSLNTVPDIPEEYPNLRRLIAGISKEYGLDEETVNKYQQGARIGFWILKSFWYKLDPIKHPPGRD